MSSRHAMADIVTEYLVLYGTGTRFDAAQAWPVYSSRVVDTPDNAVFVKDTAGVMDGRIHNTGESISHPGIQVMVRANDYAVGSAKAYEIVAALDAVRERTIHYEGSLYIFTCFTRTTDVIPLGEREARQRDLFSINGIVTITRL